MNSINEKVISVKDAIFDKDKYWDRKKFQYYSNNIKKLNNIINWLKFFN